ncbi:MAG TPA: tRNA epoxyqueuosine(34) reductase QueG [Gemmatimonadales bacterium]|nr:tRNA epoxyqueuosine(34) reductase QueG [Gemmatimonadales bacterium]
MTSGRVGNAATRSAQLKDRALALGFDGVGITTLETNAHAGELDEWLARGYAGSMTYLHRQAERRKSPAGIWPDARFAVVTLSNYYRDMPEPAGPRIARYARSIDYHRTVGRKLGRLGDSLRELAPGAETRAYVDAGPVPERELAVRAGLGWIGKNMMHINPTLGSFTFIGVLLTNAALVPDLPYAADRCGSCRRCLEACPTQAFVAPHLMDARRCIAYLTIEHRGPFDDEQRRGIGDWLFGCDVCQDVCPWNEKFAGESQRDPDFALPPELAHVDAGEFETLGEDEFNARFGALPFERAGLAGMRRNAAAVRHNQTVR